MNWSLSEYNLICYGDVDLDIFRHWTGEARFDGSRLFEHTSKFLRTRYENNLLALAELPTLVVAEIQHRTDFPAFFSRIERPHKSGDDIGFRFNHLHRTSSEEVFERKYFNIDKYEKHRTHWAVKEGNLVESFFKLLRDSQKEDQPKFFRVEQWPLPILGHIAVMMPFEKELDPVYEVIRGACKAQRMETRRVDEIYKPTKIMDDVFQTIVQSQLVICDLTNRNANVLYETGLAHALNQDVILIAQNMDDIPFDLRQFRVIKYLPNQKELTKLAEDLQQTIRETLAGRPD